MHALLVHKVSLGVGEREREREREWCIYLVVLSRYIPRWRHRRYICFTLLYLLAYLWYGAIGVSGNVDA